MQGKGAGLLDLNERATILAIAHDHFTVEVPGLSRAGNLERPSDPDDLRVALLHELLRAGEGLHRVALSTGVGVITRLAVHPDVIARLK